MHNLTEKTIAVNTSETFNEQEHKGGPVLYMSETECTCFLPVTMGDLWFQIDEIQDALTGVLESLKAFRADVEGDRQPPLVLMGTALDYAMELLWHVKPKADQDRRGFDIEWHTDGGGRIVFEENNPPKASK